MVAGAPPSPAPPPALRHLTFGRSVQGRPLRLLRVGDPGAAARILVVGCVHGNEAAGRRAVRVLARSRPPRGTALWLVPTLNPDGEHAHTRGNAHGVDLNRNFPWRWAPTGPPGSVYYAGPRPASEPETRALERLVRRVRPDVSVWYHQHARLVYRQGGARPGLIGAYARRVGLATVPSPPYPGTAIRWENHAVRDSTAWVVELAAGRLPASAARRHARAVLAAGRTLSRSAG